MAAEFRQRARGARSWGEYRRDLLVSLIDPLILQPARMSGQFDQVWVGTEVRAPQTRRMGFVQPTEGYINFRWLTAVAGGKVWGAWFDHIECSAQNFFDQACQSVLAGARELTLFHLGDVMDGHPGDTLLAARWPQLCDLASRIREQPPWGIGFYKPPAGEADDNQYLADYLGMIGLPMLPAAEYPEAAKVVLLPAQAAADPQLLPKMQRHLDRGATLILTPALVRAVGNTAAALAGVEVGPKSIPAAATEVKIGDAILPVTTPLELDSSLKVTSSAACIHATLNGQSVPLLTSLASGQGSVFVLNVRTFSEQDFRDAGEWLLAPKPRGLPEMPQELADALRAPWLGPIEVDFSAPAGVALYLYGESRCVYNFRNQTVRIRLDGNSLDLAANQWLWRRAP